MTLATGERVRYFDGPAPRRAEADRPPTGEARDGGLLFKCSFVKASKLLSPRSTLVQRLQERYGGGGGDGAAMARPTGRTPVDPSDVVVSGEVGTALGSQRPIELVGVQKLKTQQTLSTVEKISLAGCQIDEMGTQTPGELARLVPSITEVDLGANLFSTWTVVFGILAELPALETLILNGNRLDYDEAAGRGAGRFENVKVLVLNQTAVPWEQLMTLLDRHFPNLVELHVADNEFSDEDISRLRSAAGSSWMTTLEVLDLSLNNFRSWSLLHETLGVSLVNLKQLIVNNNHFSTLASSSSAPGFLELQSLSVNNNAIDSWTSIDALNRYPRLTTLRFMRNPLTAQMGVGEARMIVVARTDRIAVFNASEIQPKERRDSEQLYFKRILHELAVVGSNPGERARILADHPRFDRLREIYPDIAANFNADGASGSQAGPSKLSSSLVSVKIVPFSMEATTFDPLVKKIPEKMKVSQLKLLIAKKFGVQTTAQLLSLSIDPKVGHFSVTISNGIAPD